MNSAKMLLALFVLANASCKSGKKRGYEKQEVSEVSNYYLTVFPSLNLSGTSDIVQTRACANCPAVTLEEGQGTKAEVQTNQDGEDTVQLRRCSGSQGKTSCGEWTPVQIAALAVGTAVVGGIILWAVLKKSAKPQETITQQERAEITRQVEVAQNIPQEIQLPRDQLAHQGGLPREQLAHKFELPGDQFAHLDTAQLDNYSKGLQEYWRPILIESLKRGVDPLTILKDIGSSQHGFYTALYSLVPSDKIYDIHGSSNSRLTPPNGDYIITPVNTNPDILVKTINKIYSDYGSNPPKKILLPIVSGEGRGAHIMLIAIDHVNKIITHVDSFGREPDAAYREIQKHLAGVTGLNNYHMPTPTQFDGFTCGYQVLRNSLQLIDQVSRDPNAKLDLSKITRMTPDDLNSLFYAFAEDVLDVSKGMINDPDFQAFQANQDKAVAKDLKRMRPEMKPRLEKYLGTNPKTHPRIRQMVPILPR